MKKIYNYFILKVSSYKILVIFIVLCAYQFGLFIELIGQPVEYNIYDLLIKQYDYLPLFIVISLGYLLITYNFCSNSNFYKYLHLKFKNRLSVFNMNVMSMFIIAILYVFSLNVIAVIEGFIKISFKNSWSPYFFYKMTGKINVFYDNSIVSIVTQKLTPLKYVIYTNMFIILYLSFLGILFIVVNNFTNKKPLAFITTIGVNAISMALDSQGVLGKSFSFTHNIYILTSSKSSISNSMFIFYRLLYWSVLLIILYFIGKTLILKTDLKYGD